MRKVMEFGAALKENVRGIGTGIAWTFARIALGSKKWRGQITLAPPEGCLNAQKTAFVRR